jgi:hypothetical protein
MSNNDSTWRFVAFGYALVGVIILILAASLFVEKAGATECQTLPDGTQACISHSPATDIGTAVVLHNNGTLEVRS